MSNLELVRDLVNERVTIFLQQTLAVCNESLLGWPIYRRHEKSQANSKGKQRLPPQSSPVAILLGVAVGSLPTFQSRGYS
jgi:hypothetical protein